MKSLRIALAQINPTVGALAENAEKIRAYAVRAAEAGAGVVVFPELAVSGYPPEDLILKDHFVDDCMGEVERILPALPPGVMCLIGSPWDDTPEREPPARAYNAAVVACDGGILGVYRKMLLPNYGVFDEQRVFAAGERPLVVRAGGRRISVQICEDSWCLDQGPCAAFAGGAPELIVNLSASPYHRGKLRSRREALGRAARHGDCPLVYCNLVGGQDELVFDGASLVLDASGGLVARAGQFEEDLLVVDLPLGSPRCEPMLPDLEEVYRALSLGLRDYVDKNRFEKVVIALSGGVDSALVGVLAVDALGRERVVGLTMPSPYSSAATLGDARRLAEQLGIPLHEVPIRELFDGYRGALAETFAGRAPDTAEENLQARIRGNLIMAYSNKFGWLVLTTGNKSEVAVGYCTLYGDMVGGFAVLKDVPKTLVWELCRWRNARSERPVIPPTTIDRPPSAELRPDQRDTDSLPPYPVLDPILERYVEQDASVDEIAAAGFDRAMVERVARLVDGSEYKRRQSAPGVKITPKAFGRDRRLPITNAYRDLGRGR